jgi:hypothetical protein
MKRALLVASAAMLVAGAAFATTLPIGYIGVFSDETHTMDSTGNFACPALYGQFQAWIWCLPSIRGLQAAEFALGVPSTVVRLATAKNGIIILELGSLDTGMSVAFAEGDCKTDWVWLYNLTMMLLAPTPAKIEILPHPGVLPYPAYEFASCLPGYPIEECRYLTPLYVCWTPSPIGVEETSWGAIKSLF